MISTEIIEEKFEVLRNIYLEANEFHLIISQNCDRKHDRNFNRTNKRVLTKLMEINDVIKDNRITQIYFNNFNFLSAILDENMFMGLEESEKIKYLLITSMFYTNKVENSFYLDMLRKKTENEGIDMKIINIMELLIINKSKKFYKINSEEIYENLLFSINLSQDDCIYEKYNTLLNYSLSESLIYLSFDLFIITFSCLFISLNYFKEGEKYSQYLKEISLELNMNEGSIKSCINLILKDIVLDNKCTEKGRLIRIHKKKVSNKKLNKLKSHRKINVFA